MTRTSNIAKIPWTNFEALLAAEWRDLASKSEMQFSYGRSRRDTVPSIIPRGLNRIQAAALTGLSPTGFDKARREGKYPGPTLPGGKFDRTLIERTMDRLSGIDKEETPSSALDAWRNRGSRTH
ncbi:hypothetical protein [Bradyrhizobium sp. AZCC 2289]|uniref:hypothetical protein n=1 Tax=Bradyrhizobium sp. AZCC 2289 TaxID=3117026 RepID=UPI002FEFC351